MLLLLLFLLMPIWHARGSSADRHSLSGVVAYRMPAAGAGGCGGGARTLHRRDKVHKRRGGELCVWVTGRGGIGSDRLSGAGATTRTLGVLPSGCLGASA